MKIRKFLAFMLAATTLFAFTSCSDDDEDGDVVINGHGYNIAFGAVNDQHAGCWHFALGNDLNDDAILCIDIAEDFLGKTLDLTEKNHSELYSWWTQLWWRGGTSYYWCDEGEKNCFKSGSLLVERTGKMEKLTIGEKEYATEYFRITAKGKTYDNNTFSVSFEGPFILDTHWTCFLSEEVKAQKNKKR